jgi:hypothetical protein
MTVFYRLFSNPDVYNSGPVRTAILDRLPSEPHPSSSPSPPVALIHALVDEDDSLRSWATEQLRLYQKRPFRTNDFKGPDYNALLLLLQALDGITPSDTHFTSDSTFLWKGLVELLPCLPLHTPAHKQIALEVRDRICGHLSDSGPRSFCSFFLRYDMLRCIVRLPVCPSISRLSSSDPQSYVLARR